ncbi:MAG: NAD-dependent epimerase/dehydratase family protein [Chloroflexota bacterium]|nr:NAD-dependent epimerase/dehydratase family protein [Chloroflexota bacterium]
MKVLVTGAAGFLGSHLVDMLVEQGDEVRAMVRPIEDANRLLNRDGVEVVYGDLTDTVSLRDAVKGVQRVYNVGAKTGPWGLDEVYRAINVQGVADLINVSMEAGVERIIHTSSVTVYGHRLHGIVTEDAPFRAEHDPYSRSKIAGEQLIANLVKDRSAPVVIVRPGLIYGPRDRNSFGRFVGMVQSGKAFTVGSGKNIVPVVYVRDVATGLISAGDAGNEVIGRAYNLVNDQRVTQADYLNAMADALHVSHVSRQLPYRALYMGGRTAELVWTALGRRKAAPPPVTSYGIMLLGSDQMFSIDRARTELGFTPKYDIADGVAEGVKWFLEDQQENSGSKQMREATATKK